MATLIELANTAPRARRIAIDIPSGLDADRGEVHEPCFRADATVTMVAPKVGFLTPAGAAGRGPGGRRGHRRAPRADSGRKSAPPEG